MNQLVTTAIILTRIDYGEADRILTLLTPEHGKLHLLAKGVRRVKSKLAGGIELFSVSTITYIRGKRELGMLVSTRLVKHYGNIVGDIDRTMLGYELIKQLNRATEDEPESAYFELLHSAFEALDDFTIPDTTIRYWFSAQLLRLAGHEPNLQTDEAGERLTADRMYDFSFDDMCFRPSPHGRFNASHIKFMRLSFATHPALVLAHVQGASELIVELAPLVQAMIQTYIRV